MPGCEDAKLRDFGMTLGVRDTRKIDALYNMTGRDVREQARDGYGMLIIPTTGRYFHVPFRSLVLEGIGICWLQAVPQVVIGCRMPRFET
jgi:hypothetical protein